MSLQTVRGSGPAAAGALAFLLSLGATFALLSWQEEDPGTRRGALDDASGGGRDADDLRANGVQAPTWRVGQAWRVHFARTGDSCDLVVAFVDDAGYTQGAACEDAARIMATDAVFDRPYLGYFGRDLSGHTAEGAVRFYDWPLVDGKRWRATWEGQPVFVQARFEPQLPAGPSKAEPGYSLRMTLPAEDEGDGALVATYDYVPSMGWWSHFRLASGWRMEVRPLEGKAPAEAILANANQQVQGSHGPGDVLPTTFIVGRTEHMLVFQFLFDAPSLQRLQVTRPGGEVAYEDLFMPLESPETRTLFLDSVPGMWRVDVQRAGTGTAGYTVHAVTFTTLSLR